MKSKVWCLVVGVFLVAGSMATQAAQFGDFTYESIGTGITITKYTGPGGDVIIPDTINGLPVTRIGVKAFEGRRSLTSIVITDSVTSIGDWAFADCTGMTSVTIGNGVASIGWRAFLNCTSLSSIVIPDSVTMIGDWAFSGCTGLTSVTIGNSVTEIGELAFAGCTGLTGIMIPKNVTMIASQAFAFCRSLVAITVEGSNPLYSNLDGVLFNKQQDELIQYPGGKEGSYAIPDSVTKIKRYAFYGCLSLVDVTIPNSVTHIESAAFSSSGLRSVTIPDGVLAIGGLLTGGRGHTPGAFDGCVNLSSVLIGKGVADIGNGAFAGCTELTVIEVDALNTAYSSLHGVLFSKPQTALTLCPPGKAGDYIIPDGVKGIEPRAFLGCTGLTSIVIPDSVTSIGEQAFSGCTGLTSVVIPDRVHWIGVGAFSGCTALTSVYFQGSPPSFTYDVFHEADNATVYYLPGRPGWEATYAGRPAVLWNPLLSAQGVQMDGFRIGVTGTSDIPIVVEVAADLAESNWTPLYSGTLTDGSMDVFDPDWADDKSRFYRVRSP